MDDYEKAKNGLVPVTRDLISELRMKGLRTEANNLLIMFRNNCYNQKQQDKKEIEKIIRKKKVYNSKKVNNV